MAKRTRSPTPSQRTLSIRSPSFAAPHVSKYSRADSEPSASEDDSDARPVSAGSLTTKLALRGPSYTQHAKVLASRPSSDISHREATITTKPDPDLPKIKPSSIQCLLPPHPPFTFSDLPAFEAHYHKEHTNRCTECYANFPDAHLLELHLSERHDPLAAARRARGDRTFACFLPTCDRVCSEPAKRRRHMIDKHGFPKDYDFRVIVSGLRPGQSSLLRHHGAKTRSGPGAERQHKPMSASQVGAGGRTTRPPTGKSAAPEPRINGTKSSEKESQNIGKPGKPARNVTGTTTSNDSEEESNNDESDDEDSEDDSGADDTSEDDSTDSDDTTSDEDKANRPYPKPNERNTAKTKPKSTAPSTAENPPDPKRSVHSPVNKSSLPTPPSRSSSPPSCSADQDKDTDALTARLSALRFVPVSVQVRRPPQLAGVKTQTQMHAARSTRSRARSRGEFVE